MPTTVSSAFAAANLKPDGVVKWGLKIPSSNSGVYIVSLNNSADAIEGLIPNAPLNRAAFVDWISVCPNLTLDNYHPTVDQLIQRIQSFWLPDEVILYIGKATSLASRVNQYYRTPIGARSPHSGGYFLKLLSNLDDLWVHYSETDEPELSEKQIVSNFIGDVSDNTKSLLYDPSLPLPFANLNIPNGVRKGHGLGGARSENKLSVPADENTTQQSKQKTQKVGAPMDEFRTQRITAKDLESGRIRIPSTNTAQTKSILPQEKDKITIILREQTFHCSYDPRMGPDKQRSGLIQIGSKLRHIVSEDEVLTVTKGSGGKYVIE